MLAPAAGRVDANASMDLWTVIRFLHVLALALFVGGQLALVAVVVPVMRRQPDDVAMRALGRRFGVASVVALGVLLATGIAMAERSGRWGDDTLQLKLVVLAFVAVLAAFHAITPRNRAISIAVFAGSLALVWLGVSLSH
jgi:putative copper export protein